MNPDLHDDVWARCGTSLLWDAAALNRICTTDSVRSLREFLRLHEVARSNGGEWQENALRLINGRTLMVAGLDSALDTLDPDAACQWLEQKVYPAILDFQENVADGGREAALIFWLADRKRVHYLPAENSYHWHCTGLHRHQQIPLGRCIWNGAQGSAQRIMTTGDNWTGLFLPRIS